MQSESPIRFLDVGAETTQGVAEGDATLVGSKKLARLETSFCVGAKIMDEVPQLETVLESIRGQDILDDLWRKSVTSTAPKSGQSKLCICVHRGSFQKALLRVEELANERIVQSRLPFLNDSKFQASVVRSACEWIGAHTHIEILVFTPVAKCQFSLYKLIMCKLKILA